MKIYLVGGSVRDELLGSTVQDKDYVVIGAREKDFLESFPQAKKVGGDKPVYIYRGSEYTLSEQEDIYQDLWSRDLTINSLAKNQQGELFSIKGALDDLQNKVLRPVQDKNFFDDGLRVYRAARIAACLTDFKVHESLFSVMRQVGASNILQEVSAERVGQELKKACSCTMPGRFLRMIRQTDLLSPWFEELHSLSSLEQTASLMDKLAGDPLLVWMGLCQDFAKDSRKGMGVVDARQKREQKNSLAGNLGIKLRLPKKFIQGGTAAEYYSSRAEEYPELPSTEKVDLLMDLHKKGFLQQIFELVRIGRDKDFSDRMNRDLKEIMGVRLPEKDQGLGARSGEKLKQMRSAHLEKLYDRE